MYQFEPPIEGHPFAIVSAAYIPFYNNFETFIFPATAAGEVIDYGELRGSQRGTAIHEDAIRDAGYDLVPRPQTQIDTLAVVSVRYPRITVEVTGYVEEQ